MRGREEDEDEVVEEGVFAQEGVSVYDEVRTREENGVQNITTHLRKKMKPLRIRAGVSDKVTDGSENLPSVSKLPRGGVECGKPRDAFVEGQGDVTRQHRTFACGMLQ